MPDLSHFLLPQSLLLSLNSEKEEAVLEEILEHLKEDHRVTNWQELYNSILVPSPFPLSSKGKIVAMLYHGRTSSIRDFVIAVGRSNTGIFFENATAPIRLIFVIAIPHALNQEYLRVMGSIARVCNDATTVEKLLLTPSSEEFIGILSENEKE
jgi:mannitol/fructose-specific phosphotransferase system IIA component (Ntr-type)